ncbi:MAG TPA: response regulator [Chthonomonadaceae bacterium]|nr:response regulator [Chthonomonadaceae bacterium]
MMPTEERPNAAGKTVTNAPLPRFVLPEVVGVAMRPEAIAEIVQRSIEEMASGLECTRLIALSYAPKEGLLRGVGTAGFTDETIRELRLPLSALPAADRALRTREILVLPSADSLPPRFAAHLAGEIVVVPLSLGERALAVLIGQMAPGVAARSAAWQARAQEIAARAALSVELQRVAAAYQDELRLRQSTRTIANAILTGAPLADIAEQIAEIVSQRLREERVAVFLQDANGQAIPIALRHVSSEYAHFAARLAPRSPIVNRAQASGVPLHTRNVQEDTRFSPGMREWFRREGITSILIALLRYGEAMRGALVVYPQDERQFTPAELAIFQSFADQATLAIALTQLLAQQREVAVMEERNRLAREMHDTVAQALAGLVLQIQTAEERLEHQDAVTAQEILAGARAQAKKALEDTRRAVQGLSPASLESRSPADAIAEEVAQLEAQAGITAQFVLMGEEQPLTPEQQLALLRIAQEALTNARKHAQARRVRVGLQYGAEDVTLVVEDDGVGFDVDSRSVPGPEGGYGLFGMNERARLVGGELRIESTPGWGTRVQARLPYHPASPLAARPADRALLEPAGSPVGTALTPPRAALPDIRTQHSTEVDDHRLRVLIADDHAVTRQGVRAMLEASGEIAVVGEAADGAQAAAQARALRPDVVLMDLQMPGVDGLEGLRRIQAEQPDLPVVILTTFQTDEALREALRAGARGYLLKDAEPANIVAAVRAAHRGESLLSPAVTARLSALASGQAARPAEAADLNERELEVLQLLAQGARNKDIAAQLFITSKTVEYHLSNIFSKLGVSNRTEAARAAIERGLIRSNLQRPTNP